MNIQTTGPKTTNNYHKKIASGMTALLLVGSFAVTIPAMADTTVSAQATVHPTPGTPPWQGGQGQGDKGQGHGAPGMRGGMMGEKPAAVGKVTAVSGNTISITARQGFGSTSPEVAMTVDATNAIVVKNNATSSVSSIAVGDTIVVQGTVSGTTVVATSIRDGIMMMREPGEMGKGGMQRPGGEASTTIMGNGQPLVAGTVSAVNGSSLTITNKSNVTYTVDASNAKVTDGRNTLALSSVAVGDSVIVQGTISGSSVTASSVIDQAHKTSTTGSTNTSGKPAEHGFLGGIGDFFMHLFGF